MPVEEPPATQEEYIQWARASIGANFDEDTERLYTRNVTLALVAAQGNAFFADLDDFLREEQGQYHTEKNSDLLMSDASVKLLKKPYESAVNKSFRHNVVHNGRWPNEPEGGWLIPSNWFTRLNDVVRGTIVCKYIDAPKLLAERLKVRADEFGLAGYYTSKQRDAGYYAYHFHVKIPMEFDRVDPSGKGFVAEYVDLEVELQLTTQLQEVLYGITHRFYQHTRDKRSDDPDAWKWEVGSPRFRAGYLGHTLHLLEAMILELRDGESSDRTATPQEETNVQS